MIRLEHSFKGGAVTDAAKATKDKTTGREPRQEIARQLGHVIQHIGDGDISLPPAAAPCLPDEYRNRGGSS